MTGLTLELALPPPDAARLVRLRAIGALRRGRARLTRVELIWHDTAEGALAAEGLALCERREGRARRWQLTPLQSEPPGTVPAVLAEAASPAELGRPLPEPLLPVAACVGRLRSLVLEHETGPILLNVLEGRLRSASGEPPICRVTLQGAAAVPLALSIAETLPLAPPIEPLAGEALAAAGRRRPPRPLGTPALTADFTVSDAFGCIVGHQLRLLLHHAPEAADGAAPEPVHQMRVTLRRLRSAFKLFRRAADCPALQEVGPALKELADRLGPARDWDVFLGGTARAVAACFPDDKPLARLLAGASRERAQSYAALRAHLEGPGFRQLAIRLAALAAERPWEAVAEAAADQAAALAEPLADYAAHALSRRRAQVLAAGSDLAALAPAELHALRIRGKRLRYAVEFFAPLYPPRPARRFIRRVATLQDRLGHLNDGAVAVELMAKLDGGTRGYGGGLVRGFVAGGEKQVRAKLARAWRRLRRQAAFWT